MAAMGENPFFLVVEPNNTRGVGTDPEEALEHFEVMERRKPVTGFRMFRFWMASEFTVRDGGVAMQGGRPVEELALVGGEWIKK